MLGNLFRESGVVQRLSNTAQNELINIITIFLGLTVGATASADKFLSRETLMITGLGLVAFAFSTVGGVLLGKLMYWITGGKVNPLIGSEDSLQIQSTKQCNIILDMLIVLLTVKKLIL
jgi:oxaloacetate decarboxylase beta subunit